MTQLQKQLFSLQDKGYKSFHEKLIPTINPELVIGVRTPVLRKFAKEFSKSDDAKSFLEELPHKYYEENNLHAFIVQKEKDFNKALSLTEKFLPYIDNWATCDCFSPKVFKKHTKELLPHVKRWINSGETYVVRYGIKTLMDFYSDENFSEEYLKIVASVKSEEYYVNMMISWYFATLMAKQYEKTVPYIEKRLLPKWVHNKTIQKCIESYRIPKEIKDYLKTRR